MICHPDHARATGVKPRPKAKTKSQDQKPRPKAKTKSQDQKPRPKAKTKSQDQKPRPKAKTNATLVGRTPGSAADAPVGAVQAAGTVLAATE
jgi:hypothetical protein